MPLISNNAKNNKDSINLNLNLNERNDIKGIREEIKNINENKDEKKENNKSIIINNIEENKTEIKI